MTSVYDINEILMRINYIIILISLNNGKNKENKKVIRFKIIDLLFQMQLCIEQIKHKLEY